jgi:multiple antibiotic resistance protein
VNVIDILLLLAVTIGPTKAAAMYLSLTAGAEAALKRQIAIRAVLTATVVCGVFALLGQALLGLFHVSIPAMLIAGGIILFVFALQLVLGEDHSDDGTKGLAHAPSLDIASFPLAVPLMASPQGLVALVAIAAAQPGLRTQLLLFVLVLVMMAFNLVFLLFADRIFSKISPGVLKVVMRVFGLLLCGLAVQLVIVGLQKQGVLAAAVGH